jgi:hypothetical protein
LGRKKGWAGGGKQADIEKMGHAENLGRRKREGEKEVGRGVLGQKGGCWRWEKGLTSGPELSVTGRKRKRGKREMLGRGG